MEPPRNGGDAPVRERGRPSKKLIEALDWSGKTGAGFREDVEKFAAREGPARARTLILGWKRQGWKGFLPHEDLRLIEYARARLSCGPDVANALHSFPVVRGFEEFFVLRLEAALSFIRQRSRKAAEDAAARQSEGSPDAGD